MDRLESYECRDLNLKATELRLGLLGSDERESKSGSGVTKSHKRAFPETAEDCISSTNSSRTPDTDRNGELQDCTPPAKAQVVGWPPVRSYRKNNLQQTRKISSDHHHHGNGGGMYVKVSMDGAPYLRKIDLSVHRRYPELLQALENMFMVSIGQYSESEGYSGSDYAPTYEDKDGDWMLLGDVPWEMFSSTCKRMRIMRSSEAKGLGCQ
ncbi:hypothetical protein Nepgr_004217 [Nepenthes gracilis]|uniref:Auxin-responsive protein n=1 Tax=Nepenthes gracilis TaxID=150966 RepID=A0AAD3S0X9_NEPGR|nr:hypothetical protein Nepgr_004217 [Nepenthes gracilis]